MWKDDAYLLDMLLAAKKALDFTKEFTSQKFLIDDLVQNAVMRQIQIIGEAARKISDDSKKAHPEIPWKEIVAMRHRLVHEYFDIIPEKVWSVIETDIPRLIRQIEPLVPPEEQPI